MLLVTTAGVTPLTEILRKSEAGVWRKPADEGRSAQCSEAKYHLGEPEANRTQSSVGREPSWWFRTAQHSTIGARGREGTTPGGDLWEQVLSFDKKKMLQIARHFPGWQVAFINPGTQQVEFKKRISPEPSNKGVALNNELETNCIRRKCCAEIIRGQMLSACCTFDFSY